MKKYGPEVLSDAELMAMLFDTGSKKENVVTLSRRFLEEKGGLKGIFLCEGNLESYGIKDARSCKLQAVREIFRRLPFQILDKVLNEETAFQLCRNYFSGKDHELAVILYLSADKRLLRKDVYDFSERDRCLVPVGLIVRNAIQTSASFVLAVHNHPSGCLFPSDSDMMAISELSHSLGVANVVLLDSLIVCDEDYLSMRKSHFTPFE